MGQLMAGEDSGIATTIVGGQPPGRGRAPLGEVPLGMEQVLYLAAVDPGFREDLLADAGAAVEDRGLPLRASERAMLSAIPPAQLDAAVAAIDTSADNVQRRSFMKLVAAGAMTIAAAEATAGCTEGADTGIRPYDLARPEVAPEAGPAPTGIRPDVPGGATDAGGPPGK
jgi:hypothetical protein